MTANATEAAAVRAELVLLDDLVGSDPEAGIEQARALRARAERLPGPDGPELVAAAQLFEADAAERAGGTADAARLVTEVRTAWLEQSTPLPAELSVRAALVLVRVHVDLADFPTALEHALDAVAVLGDDVPPRLQVWVHIKVADLLDELGSLDEARTWYAKAEVLADGDARMHMLVVNNLAYGELMAGDVEVAGRHAQRLADLSRRYDRPLNANELDTVAHIHLLRGDSSEAVRVARSAVASHARMDARNGADLPEYLLTLVTALRHCGDLAEAAATLAQARSACAEDGFGDVKARLLEEEAEVLAAAGDFRGAYTAHKAFHAADKELLSEHREAQARTRQAVYETSQARADADRFREQARRDPLTGLHNRLSVGERLPELLAARERTSGVLAVLMLDLDHFKAINDHYSHEVGDAVLVAVSRILTDAVAHVEAGFAARLGGEEFLLVVPAEDEARALAVAERTRAVVEAHDWSGLVPGRGVTVSVGVVFAGAGSTQKALLTAADVELYAAKAHGRNRVCVAVGASVRPSGPRDR